MKLHNIFLLATVALATAFTSCSDDDSYNAGKQAGAYNIGFADESSVTVGLTDKTFDVTLTREDTDGDVTVPVSVLNESDSFTVPTSATFKDGESEAVITVGVPENMETFTEYNLTLRIPEEYTNPYNSDAYSPIYKVVIVKEDYAAKATGTFYDNWFNADENGAWVNPVTVEYSTLLDLYRVKDIFATGNSNMYFKWNTETNVITITDANGDAADYLSTGYLYDSDYGCYCGWVDEDQTFYYDPADKTFHLPFDWGLEEYGPYWGITENTIVLN